MTPSVDDVVEAFEGIEKARENYRATLRASLAEGIVGRQAEIARRLNRTREMLRRDAMTDEQRATPLPTHAVTHSADCAPWSPRTI